MRLLSITLLVLACFTVCSNASFGQQTSCEFQTNGSTLHYWLYDPRQSDTTNVADSSSEQKTFPLVLFLHGGGEGGSDLEKVKKHGLPKLIEAGRQFPFFVASPQNPSEKQFWDDQQLIQLVDQLLKDHPIDAGRVYLMGLSRGAYGAWRLAIQNPDRFAALVPIAGGGAVPYVGRLKEVPTWVFHGALDQVIPVSESERMVDALRRAGGDVRITIYPDAKHDSWTKTFENPKVYEWILSQRQVETSRSSH